MHGFLTVLIGILMLATLGVLVAGLVGMVREGDPRRVEQADAVARPAAGRDHPAVCDPHDPSALLTIRRVCAPGAFDTRKPRQYGPAPSRRCELATLGTQTVHARLSYLFIHVPRKRYGFP